MAGVTGVRGTGARVRGRRAFPLWLAATIGGLAFLLLGSMAFAGYQLQSLVHAFNEQRLEERLAVDLSDASDYLTSEIRQYAVTGEVAHLTNYWTEVNQTRTRERVLDEMRALGAPAEELAQLELAKANSDVLVDTEIQSMRLMLESRGVPEDQMPPEVAAVPLTPADAALTPEGKAARARYIVNDQQYAEAKAAIMGPIAEFERLVTARNEADQRAAQDAATASFWLLVAVTLLVVVLVPVLLMSYQARLRRALREAALALSTTAQEIMATAAEQERTAVDQSAALEQTTSTMAELDASASESLEKAIRSADGSRRTLDEVTEGSRHAGLMRQVTADVTVQAERVATKMSQLSERIDEIRGISAAVRELAMQTNLLALNASVEAVRAGEAGTGFSVVAGEIRKLADRSAEAAERIGLLVTDVLKRSAETIAANRVGGASITQLVALSDESERVFAAIAGTSNSSADEAHGIMLNLRQQLAAVNEVVEAMESVNAGARETAAGISQLRAGVAGINEAADRLIGLV